MKYLSLRSKASTLNPERVNNAVFPQGKKETTTI